MFVLTRGNDNGNDNTVLAVGEDRNSLPVVVVIEAHTRALALYSIGYFNSYYKKKTQPQPINEEELMKQKRLVVTWVKQANTFTSYLAFSGENLLGTVTVNYAGHPSFIGEVTFPRTNMSRTVCKKVFDLDSSTAVFEETKLAVEEELNRWFACMEVATVDAVSKEGL